VKETLSLVVSSSGKGKRQPALYIGLAGDTPYEPPARISLSNVEAITLGRGEQRSIRRAREERINVAYVTLADPRMSSRHARLVRFGGAWLVEDLGSKNGTYVGGARVDRKQVFDHDVIVVGHTALVFREAGGDLPDLFGWPEAPDPGLMTLSPDAAERFAELATAARAKIPVELTGESGTGKELAARAVHQLSGRTGRFVAVNCGALPANLLEGELFGHKRGAFTGANDDRLGFIRAADGGTLFLDEIAELPAASQAALLRVLQEGEVVPLGADRPIKVDLRLVTATLKDLDEEVEARRFREDLRARILGVKVEMPPLRERREDLGWLIATLLQRTHGQRPVTFAADAIGLLYQYDWPLNIRELERALAAAGLSEHIQVGSLPQTLRDAPRTSIGARPGAPLTAEDEALKDRLAASIAKHKGNLSAVARELDKDRKQIQRWVSASGSDARAETLSQDVSKAS
jgi:transcriptional regulator of acetoin/glycerol metabolism